MGAPAENDLEVGRAIEEEDLLELPVRIWDKVDAVHLGRETRVTRELSLIERQREIQRLVIGEKRVDIHDLRRRFGVSEVTIRKDLSMLEAQGVLLRTHGGAVIAERPDMVIPHVKREQENVEAKHTIARAAARLISDGEFVILDAGSSTLALASELKGRDLSVVTNSLLIAHQLAGEAKVNLIVLGGSLRHSSLAFIGPMSCSQAKALHVDKAFMGVSGFDLKSGFSSQNLIESETKAAMMAAAREVIILADRSKMEKPAFAAFAPLSEVDALITDAPPPPDHARALAENGVRVIVADG